jgi:hypothetical protein
MSSRAGTPAAASDLIDVEQLLDAYWNRHPDVSDPEQRVVFGTSGHRGSSLKTAFNDDHIAAITQAIVEYRASQGITGPLFVGRDTHALSAPAQTTALEVLVANQVRVLIDEHDGYTPTPAVSHAIIRYNRANGGDPADQADGIVITPSHNPPADGGFKYNPPHGGPADTDATIWIANRANELIADGLRDVRRAEPSAVESYDFQKHYVEDLASIVDMAAIKEAGLHIGADPLGGASVQYWGRIAETHGLDLTVVNPEADPHGERCGRRPARHRHPRRGTDEPEPLPGGGDRVPVPAPAAVARGRRGGQDPRLLVDDRPGRRVDRPPAGRGAGRLQVVRAGADRRLRGVRRRGERGRELPPHGRHGLDHGQGRHPALPARE